MVQVWFRFGSGCFGEFFKKNTFGPHVAHQGQLPWQIYSFRIQLFEDFDDFDDFFRIKTDRQTRKCKKVAMYYVHESICSLYSSCTYPVLRGNCSDFYQRNILVVLLIQNSKFIKSLQDFDKLSHTWRKC